MSASRRHSRRFASLVILAYLAVVATLLALALFGRGASERLADARVTVRYAALPLFGRSVARATISYHGLRLSFDTSTPIVGSDGATAAPRELSTHGEGIDIGFEAGFRLELRDAGDGSLSIAVAGGSAGQALSLAVPVRVPGGLRSAGDEPIVTWRRSGRGYYLSLPPGSLIDETTGLLLLTFGAGSREVRLGPVGGEELSARWLADQAALVDEAALRAGVDAFLDAAWNGWTTTRLSADRTLWRGADGRYAYREDLASALLAESLARGEYPARRALVAAALERALRAAPGSVSSATASAFVGSLREHARRVRAAEAPGIERVRALLADRDPALFLEPGLVPFVLDHGPFNLVQEIVTLAGTLRAGSLEPGVALGVLEAYLDYDEFAAGGGAMAANAREVARTRLLPGIVKIEKGLFLETAEGTAETAVSMRCGAALVRAATALGDPSLAAIGRTLIASAVALAQADGFLPRTLDLAGDGAGPADVAPESVYGFLTTARRLPREIPLHLVTGPGAWLWTAAELLAAEGGPTQLSLTLGFPAGQPHYLMLDGVRSVAKIELHGAAWRPAAEYAQYSDGWAYDAAEQQLFVKLTSRADTEQIVITY
jgi:hypothetical protein